MRGPTLQDEGDLTHALLNLGSAIYEQVREELINELGYDQFRELQNHVFMQIGTIKAEKGTDQ